MISISLLIRKCSENRLLPRPAVFAVCDWSILLMCSTSSVITKICKLKLSSELSTCIQYRYSRTNYYYFKRQAVLSIPALHIIGIKPRAAAVVAACMRVQAVAKVALARAVCALPVATCIEIDTLTV